MVDRTPEALLAKTPRNHKEPRREETLVGHASAVIRAAEAIFESIEKPISETFALSGSDTAFLKKCVQRAALLHDLGKANHQFQNLMRGKNQKQALRHEWISAWLPLWSKELALWLFGEDSTLRDVVLCAVLGHHLKAEGGSIECREGSGNAYFRCHWGHDDVRECLERARSLISIPNPPPVIGDVEIDLTDRPLKELRSWFVDDLLGQELVPLAKALLMAADIAGSALPVNRDLDMEAWIMETLGRRCGSDELNGIVRQRLRGHRPRDFQKAVANSTHRITVVRAGCGSGKTVAAYMWAAERAKGRKLFICYPTTGTATEGFRDYIIASDLLGESALLHSRSTVDIERILEGEPDATTANPGLGISALVSWDVPITVCTADTVLGIIQNGRQALYSSPAFMNAAFVFDEIHQYDKRMWGALIRFLNAFSGVPVLLMTASLPQARRQELLEAFRGQITEVDGPPEHERIARYVLRCDEAHPWSHVEKVLKEGGKVLWVCNTVSRCVKKAKEAQKRFMNVRIHPYHSRYRYIDRLERHNDVMESFAGDEPVLAFTTQVCEVSLDISADLLLTDLAPIPALIQRLGRLNRRAAAGSPPGSAIVLAPPRSEPYNKDELKAAWQWIAMLAERPVSQKDLAEAFESVTEKEKGRSMVESEWLDGGKFAVQSPLREAGYTIPVIREEDVATTGWPIGRDFAVKYEIPMLFTPETAREIGGWKRTGHAWMAPGGRVKYDARWGATWAKRNRTDQRRTN